MKADLLKKVEELGVGKEVVEELVRMYNGGRSYSDMFEMLGKKGVSCVRVVGLCELLGIVNGKGEGIKYGMVRSLMDNKGVVVNEVEKGKVKEEVERLVKAGKSSEEIVKLGLGSEVYVKGLMRKLGVKVVGKKKVVERKKLSI